MAAIFYENAVEPNKIYPVYGLVKSGVDYATDIIVRGENPGFRVGDYIKWINYDRNKSFTAKIIYRSFTKYTPEYRLGYYILTVKNQSYLTNNGWGGYISLVKAASNAVEEVSLAQPEAGLFGGGKKILIGVAAFIGIYLLFQKK